MGHSAGVGLPLQFLSLFIVIVCDLFSEKPWLSIAFCPDFTWIRNLPPCSRFSLC
jgi:hypothetical protein